VDTARPLEIHVTTSEKDGTITFSDSGVGMSKDELVANIGTIARSGSKAFVERLKTESGENAPNIIGQFGVGFYSAFMVSDDITVYSKSASPGVHANRWHSTGDGTYDIAPASNVHRGTKVVIRLKPECKEFAVAKTVEDFILRHSNFVNFPVHLNGKLVQLCSFLRPESGCAYVFGLDRPQMNTVQAIWKMSKSDVTEEMYTGFFKFKSKSCVCLFVELCLETCCDCVWLLCPC
jgi:TNF receptor-associated protein 1